MVGALLVRGDKVGGRFYFGNWSDEWTSVYLEKVLADDPLVQEARRRMSLFTWSELWPEGDLPQASRPSANLAFARARRQSANWRCVNCCCATTCGGR